MAKDDSYEIMPYKEIVELKNDIEELKQKTGDTNSQELINSMAKLTKSMDSMLELFRTAAEEMKSEESTEEKFAGKYTAVQFPDDDETGEPDMLQLGYTEIHSIEAVE